MIIENARAPVSVRGVTSLMSVGADEAVRPDPTHVLAKGAILGLVAAWIIGSKRKVLFAAGGAGVMYWRELRGD